MGEEAIFVSDAIKKGLNIGFVPKTILIHSDLSTGEKQFFQNYILYKVLCDLLFGKMYLFGSFEIIF